MAQHDDETLKAMGRLMHKIGMNPKTRPAVVNAIRTIDPNARFPDIENKETKEYVDQRFAEEEEKASNRRLDAQLARERNKVVNEYGSENIESIEKFMTDNSIPNYGVAAKAWGADNRPAMPNNMPRPHEPWQQPPNMKDLLTDGKKIAFDNGYKAVDDILRARQNQR